MPGATAGPLPAQTYATTQYALIKDARRALLDYCTTLQPAHFVAPVPEFPQSNMRGLLVHVAGTYVYWLGHVGLQRAHLRLPQAGAVSNVAALRKLFAEVDELVAEFISRFAEEWLQAAARPLPNRPGTAPSLTPLQLFTHVTTHEFHHKGQLLTMSRLLGYTPIDTDVIRT